MKKVLSIVLTVAMLLSMFSCLFTTGVTAATPFEIVQDFEDGKYPLVDPGSTSGTTKIDADCKTGTDAGSVSWNSAGIVKDHEGNGNRYLKVDSNGRWIRFITNNKTGIFTDSTKKITVTFKYRVRNVNNYTGVDGRTLVSLGFFTTTGSTNNYSAQNSANNGKSESPANGVPYVNLPYSAAKDASGEWAYATISNLPYFTDNIELYTMNLSSSYTFDLDIDEIIFTEVDPEAPTFNASATVNKKMGTANVNKAQVAVDDTVIYTATEYYAGAFDGWYNGETKLTSEKVYSFTYTGVEPLALTAKYKEDVIAQTFETGFVQNGTQIDRAPDSQASKPTYATVKNDNTTYLNIGGIKDGKNIQYLTNAEETGMLKEDVTYNLTFKFRIHKTDATASNQAVKFVLQTQNGSKALGSVEKWHQENEAEWRTAEIKDITPNANDPYTKLRLEGGSGATDAVEYLTVDIDDVVFKDAKNDIEINGITTMYNNAAALRCAEYSSTGKNGLRIYNEIKKDWILKKDIVEFGSIVTYESILKQDELTLNFNKAAKGVSYKQADDISVIWEETESAYIFTTYVTGINFYDKNLVIRSYAIDSAGNTYYGDEVMVSVFLVANAMDNGNTIDGTEPTENDINSFAQFVTANNKNKYEEWCSANSVATGDLFHSLYNS